MRTWYRNLDLGAILLYLALVTIGLVAIRSSTAGSAGEFLLQSVQQSFGRQLLWLGISATAILVTMLLPLRWLSVLAYPLYGLSLVLLVTAMVAGREVGGARSWLYFGPIGFQSSELAKVGVLLALSRLVASRRTPRVSIGHALGIIVLIGVPGVMVLLQNDTGTALIYFGLIPMALFWSGISVRFLAVIASPAVAGYLTIVFMPAAILFAAVLAGWLYWKNRRWLAPIIALVINGLTIAGGIVVLEKVLQPYQLARLVAFVSPEAEEFRQGVGFHQVQSKAAIGAGGITGQGYMQGTQTQGRYIPEQSTDFIFTVIGEEWGFIGSLTVLVFYGLFIHRILRIGTSIRHPFGSMFATCAASVFFMHVVINLGMVLGLLPVIGIPLPLLSYGGSALLTNSAMLGMCLSTYMRRDEYSLHAYSHMDG